MLTGIYAPITKPTTALTMPTNAENAEFVRKNPYMNTLTSVADRHDSTVTP